MTLLSQIKSDLLVQRKAGTNKLQINLLTTLLGEASRSGLDDGKRESTDAEVIATVKKFVKGLNETIAHANTKGLDVSGKLQELETLNAYLPKQLDEYQLKLILSNLKAENYTTRSEAMKQLKERYNGQFDGKLASNIAASLFG